MSNIFDIDISSDVSLEVSFTLELCKVINTPRSLSVYLLLENKQFQDYLDLPMDSTDYLDHRNFADDYLVTTVLRKSINLDLDIDRKAQAVSAFLESEDLCRQTNDFLYSKSHHPFVEKVRLIIKQIIGPLSKRDLQRIEKSFGFGAGATTGVKGSGSVLSDKYDEELHLTSELIPFYRSILGDRWWDSKRKPVIVEGNKFASVPKTSKTDRGICIEPTLNMYIQKGIGKLLRSKLKNFGINLDDQERNRYLSSIAHKESLATIDLSAASDSMSQGCISTLIPPRWVEILDLCRSKKTLINGDYLLLEKFSSQGNGFTFDLEALIFTGIAFSCVPIEEWHHVSVFGDDIIVPQKYSHDVIEVLDYLGFKTNISKSFLAGNFFESCGTDWFNGQNVRPFYLRRNKENNIPYVVQIANKLRLYARQCTGGFYCDSRFQPLWVSLFRASPKGWRCCRVPDSFGDMGIISSRDEAQPKHCYSSKKSMGYEGYALRFRPSRPRKIRKQSFGRLLLALACVVGSKEQDISTYGVEPVRGYLRRPLTKVGWVLTWPESLSWV